MSGTNQRLFLATFRKWVTSSITQLRLNDWTTFIYSLLEDAKNGHYFKTIKIETLENQLDVLFVMTTDCLPQAKCHA